MESSIAWKIGVSLGLAAGAVQLAFALMQESGSCGVRPSL
jgi:hypothetical protein